MVLDTMTLEELIREIKTDFSEVKGRWKNYVRQVSGDYQRLAYIINDYQGVHFERLSF